MEWTVAGDDLWILQSRPISTTGATLQAEADAIARERAQEEARQTSGETGPAADRVGPRDERPWYINLHKSFSTLRELRRQVEEVAIPHMKAEADSMAMTDLTVLSDDELASGSSPKKRGPGPLGGDVLQRLHPPGSWSAPLRTGLQRQGTAGGSLRVRGSARGIRPAQRESQCRPPGAGRKDNPGTHRTDGGARRLPRPIRIGAGNPGARPGPGAGAIGASGRQDGPKCLGNSRSPDGGRDSPQPGEDGGGSSSRPC